jgi:hypothetical protein
MSRLFPLMALAVGLAPSGAHASVNFDPVTTVYAPSGTGLMLSVLHGDLDGDGDLDLVANVARQATAPLGPYASTWQVLRNDGALNFTVGSGYQPGGFAGGAALIDVDGDTHLDLVFLVEGAGDPAIAPELVVMPGDGAGGFGTAQRQAITQSSSALEVLDLDADGDLDIAWRAQSAGVPTVFTFLDQGTTLVAGQSLPTTGHFLIGFARVDADAYPDALLRPNADGGALQMLRNGAGGLSATMEAVPALPGATRVVASLDLDGSGAPELVTLATDVEREVDDEDVGCALRVHRRDGSGVLAAAGDAATRGVPCGSRLPVVRDLDADGSFEVGYVISEGDAGAFNLLRIGAADAWVQLPRAEVNGASAAVDLDGDGRRDLLAAIGFTVNIARASATANRLPVAPSLSFTVAAGATLVGSFATTDPDGNPLSYEVIDQPDASGVGLTWSPLDGGFTYQTSNTTRPGTDRFTVAVSDRSGTPVIYVVNITITGSGGGGGAPNLLWLGMLAVLLTRSMRRCAARA